MTESAPRPRPSLVQGGADAGHSGTERLRAAFRAHAATVYATARRILSDADDAEDVTQSVFETLARRAETLRDVDRLAAFLKSCAVRECLMVLRRRRWWLGRRGRRALADVPVEAGPEAFVVAAVRELLAPLTPEERAAVVLKLVEEHSHEEVAALMGISVATARRRLESARRRMLEQARDDVQRRLIDEIEVPP